jgi:hypothetical protein
LHQPTTERSSAWPGPVLGDLGRPLISDRGLGETLATISCPYGDGKASERIATLLQAFLR